MASSEMATRLAIMLGTILTLRFRPNLSQGSKLRRGSKLIIAGLTAMESLLSSPWQIDGWPRIGRKARGCWAPAVAAPVPVRSSLAGVCGESQIEVQESRGGAKVMSEITYGSGDAWPYETMVFEDESSIGLYHAPYATKEEARKGHAEVSRAI